MKSPSYYIICRGSSSYTFECNICFISSKRGRCCPGISLNGIVVSQSFMKILPRSLFNGMPIVRYLVNQVAKMALRRQTMIQGKCVGEYNIYRVNILMMKLQRSIKKMLYINIHPLCIS